MLYNCVGLRFEDVSRVSLRLWVSDLVCLESFTVLGLWVLRLRAFGKGRGGGGLSRALGPGVSRSEALRLLFSGFGALKA